MSREGLWIVKNVKFVNIGFLFINENCIIKRKREGEREREKMEPFEFMRSLKLFFFKRSH